MIWVLTFRIFHFGKFCVYIGRSIRHKLYALYNNIDFYYIELQCIRINERNSVS